MQLCYPIHSWVWVHSLGCGGPTRDSTFKNADFPAPRNHHLPILLWLGMGACKQSSSVLCWLARSCTGIHSNLKFMSAAAFRALGIHWFIMSSLCKYRCLPGSGSMVWHCFPSPSFLLHMTLGSKSSEMLIFATNTLAFNCYGHINCILSLLYFLARLLLYEKGEI